eukprot:3768254-Rhodomonas_salina.1
MSGCVPTYLQFFRPPAWMGLRGWSRAKHVTRSVTCPARQGQCTARDRARAASCQIGTSGTRLPKHHVNRAAT